MSAFIFNDPFRGRQVFTNPDEVLDPDVNLDWDFLESRTLLVGSPENVVEKIQELRSYVKPGLSACRVLAHGDSVEQNPDEPGNLCRKGDAAIRWGHLKHGKRRFPSRSRPGLNSHQGTATPWDSPFADADAAAVAPAAASAMVGKPGLEPGRLAAHDPKSCSSTNSDTSPRGEHGHYSAASFRDAIEHGWVDVRGRGFLRPATSDWDDSLASPVVRPWRRGRERTGRPDGGGLDLFQPVDHHPRGHVDQLGASVVKPQLPTVRYGAPVSSISQPLVEPNRVLVVDRHFQVDFVQGSRGGHGLDGLYQSRSRTPAAESRSNVEREQPQRARR